MTTGSDEYVDERQHAKLTPAKSLRIVRELQGLTQADLAKLSGIPQPTISAIENDQKGLGIERAKQLARALKVHPAVLAFPGWEPGANVVDLRERVYGKRPPVKAKPAKARKSR
ncbi:MAG TPA: helix-turn-helix transcriptional regulator [Polyangiaceae bacterium]